MSRIYKEVYDSAVNVLASSSAENFRSIVAHLNQAKQLPTEALQATEAVYATVGDDVDVDPLLRFAALASCIELGLRDKVGTLEPEWLEDQSRAAALIIAYLQQPDQIAATPENASRTIAKLQESWNLAA
jgi:hypothetical protein